MRKSLRIGLALGMFLVGCGSSPVSKEMAALKSASPEERANAASHLAQMGQEGVSAIPNIIELLKDSDAQVRAAAADALAGFGQAASAAVEPLAALMSDPEWSVKSASFKALAAIGAGEQLGQAAKTLLTDQSVDARRLAAILLSEIGPKAGAAVPALINTLKDSDPNVRLYSAIALGNMGKQAASAIPALQAAQGDSADFVQKAAMEALRKIQ